jgi:IS30 family transposase
MNGLIRQYLPKGINLSIYSQSDLNKIAQSLNTLSRACLGFQTPKKSLTRKYRNRVLRFKFETAHSF